MRRPACFGPATRCCSTPTGWSRRRPRHRAGIDRLLGQAERLLRGNFEGGAARLVESLGSRNDDRALLVVHRR